MVKSAAGVFIQPVDNGRAGPQWRRVHHAVHHAIASGALRGGVRLPSARQLAEDWRVSRNAVDEAFAQLQLEGLIERRVGDGTYVSAEAPVPPPPLRRPTPVAERVLQRSAVLGVAPSQLEAAWTTMRVPPLHPRGTDLELFPLDTWRRLMVQAHDDHQRALLDDVPPGGLPALREAITRHLAVHRGINCTPEQVLVINGPGEGMQIISRLLLAPGDTVWIEDPSHPSLPLLMRTLGLNVVGVPLDAGGFDVAAGCRSARGATLAYLHPLMQYPLGVRTSNERHEALLAWASKQGAWIVEGLFNDETVPALQQPPALFAHDPHGRVIGMNTFEGVMFPSLRVGYLVLPRALAGGFVAAAATLGERVPAAVQWALAEFIDRGHMTAHLKTLRAAIFRRRETVRTRLLRVLPAGVRAGPMNSGTQLCLHVPPHLNDVELASRLRRRRVIVEPLSLLAWQVRGLNGIVVGYGGWDGPVLEQALDTIVDVLVEGLAYQPTGEKA
jgi:GntR family transcriptional regulator / MocR family aminotransferase